MTATTTADAERARKCWRTLEPYHGFIYFAPEATRAYARLDIHGRSGYFLSRSAAMGQVWAPTAIATFFNFHPDLVERAFRDAPSNWSPEDVIDARYAAVDEVLRARLGDDVESAAMFRAAELATKAQAPVRDLAVGRPLALAHACLPQPGPPHLQLWWAVTTLREFRGDGHIAALVDAGVTGIEALILHAASGEVGAATLRTTREWSEDEWGAGIDGLVARGILDPDGAFTDAGRGLRTRIEEQTDRLAAPAWAALTDEEGAELRALVRPWSRSVFAGLAG